MFDCNNDYYTNYYTYIIICVCVCVTTYTPILVRVHNS